MEQWIYHANTAQVAKRLLELPLSAIESHYQARAPFLREQLQEALLHYQHPEIEQAYRTRQDAIEAVDRHVRQLLECTRQVAALLTPQAKTQLQSAVNVLPVC